MNENERRRLRALDNHQPTFRYEITEDWTGCTACGRPVRETARDVGRPGLYRLCGCEGIVWVSRHIIGEGWERKRRDEL